jgi:ATP-dependent helicase YprA (DUF1998 family)
LSDIVERLKAPARRYRDVDRYEAADEIVRLRAELHTVLTREAATIARHDAKLEAVESERDRLLYALKAKFDEDDALEQILRREP